MSTPAKQELRDLIFSVLLSGMTRTQATDAVMSLFHDVADDWDHHDVTTIGEEPGSHFLDQRWLVARVPRESRDRRLPAPDRTVAP